MADDLRQRLTNAFVAARNTYRPAAESSEWETCGYLADQALPAVVDWLLARAQMELAVPERAHTRAMKRLDRATVLQELALEVRHG